MSAYSKQTKGLEDPGDIPWGQGDKSPVSPNSGRRQQGARESHSNQRSAAGTAKSQENRGSGKSSAISAPRGRYKCGSDGAAR